MVVAEPEPLTFRSQHFLEPLPAWRFGFGCRARIEQLTKLSELGALFPVRSKRGMLLESAPGNGTGIVSNQFHLTNTGLEQLFHVFRCHRNPRSGHGNGIAENRGAGLDQWSGVLQPLLGLHNDVRIVRAKCDS